MDKEGLMFLKSFWSGGSSERLVRKLTLIMKAEDADEIHGYMVTLTTVISHVQWYI